MQLLIGTYNIQHGVLHAKRLQNGEITVNLNAAIDVLRHHAPDICAINEIYGQGVFGNQPQVIGDALSLNVAFAPAIENKYGKYGNALLSRFPIQKITAVPLHIAKNRRLPDIKYEDRVLLIAELTVNDKPLTLMVCHFGLADDEQALAIDTVIDEAERIRTPLVLMGDFNLTPDTPAYARLAAAFTDSATKTAMTLLTFPSHAPKKKIDYIFTKGDIEIMRVCSHEHVASDHLPIFAEVTL